MSSIRARRSSKQPDSIDINNVNQHPCVRKLTPLEKCYLLAVEHDDQTAVKGILEKRIDGLPVVDINCMDYLGRSAILTAIDNENLEMLNLLLSYGIEMKDAILHAINVEYIEAVELLLYHEEATQENNIHSWETVNRDMSTFVPEITPLILAAQKDNFEILKLLLDHGAVMIKPHHVKCKCDECLFAIHKDCLRHSQARLNAYRALSSPSLICLTKTDPILEAFELSWELKHLSLIEVEFKRDYLELRQRCKDFAVSLLDHVRSSNELENILNYDTGRPSDDEKVVPLARLDLALKYEQEEFVAHPNVQHLLGSLWYDGIPRFRKLKIYQKPLQIVKIGIIFPFYSLMYMLCPTSSSAKFLEKPFVKFVVHAFSYILFLILLLLDTQLTATGEMKYESQRQKYPSTTIIEIGILIYIVGYVWQETRELWISGYREYFVDMWNIIDFIRNLLFVLTAILQIYNHVKFAGDSEKASTPREKWDDYDPVFIEEGLFAAGVIFAILKLLHLFSVNPYLGPLQISLRKMAINIIQFFFIYTLVLFAFACGLNQLLWHYTNIEKEKCNNTVTMENRDTCVAWRRFSTIFESSQSLFWASFGLVDLDNFDLTGIKSYTRFWGLLLFGSYCVINMIVLINLLIAMLSNSYHTISTRSDIEWKFARTKLFLEYFEKADTLPPPFNIFPNVKLFSKIFGSKKTKGLGKLAKPSFKGRDERYKDVMKNLVWRYVTSQQRNAENHTITEDDINEIRKDISSFRYELMDVLSGSGMNTSAVHRKKTETVKKKSKTRSRQLINDFNITLAEAVDSHWERGNPSTGGFRGYRMESNWQSLIRNVCNSRVESLSRLQSDSWKYLLEDMEMLSNSGMNLRDERRDKSKDVSKCCTEDKNDIDGLIECIDSLCQCDGEFSIQVPNSTKAYVKDDQEAAETETMKNYKFRSVKIQREITSNTENKCSDIYSISASLQKSEREDADRSSLPRSGVKIAITSNIIRSESAGDKIKTEPELTWI